MTSLEAVLFSGAYEERIIGIDYAVRGIRLKYDFSDKFRMKALYRPAEKQVRFLGSRHERFEY